MPNLLDELIKRRNHAKGRLDEIKRELSILEELINQEHQNVRGTAKYTNKSRDHIYYTGKIKELLKGNEIGLKTKDLWHLFEVFYESKVKDTTFRSYLNRMKENNEIHQDEKRYWHLKE